MKKRRRKRKMEFKVFEDEYNRITLLGELYAGGNTSKWLRFSAINCQRKLLK